jgi:hypothetical protein
MSLAMSSKPVRPTPSEKVLDYDDGDPYSCVAAGNQESHLQRALQERIEACYGKPNREIDFLSGKDPASAKTALYDIWDRERQTRSNKALGDWAAEQMARLGDKSLVSYDKSNRR